MDERIEQVLVPFAPQLRLLRTIPETGERAAQVLISELGIDMSRAGRGAGPGEGSATPWSGVWRGVRPVTLRRGPVTPGGDRACRGDRSACRRSGTPLGVVSTRGIG